MAHQRMDWDEIANEDGTPPIRRQPARLAGLLGAAMLIVAGFFPFAEGRVPRADGVIVRQTLSGFDGAGDAAILLVLGLIALVILLNQGLAESSATILRFGPALLGLVAALITVTAWRESEDWIAELARNGNSGAVSIGIWLAGIGSLVLLLGGVVRSFSERDRASTEPSARLRPSRADLAEVAGAVAGGVVLSAGLLATAVSVLPTQLIAVYVIASIVGGLIGITLGGRLGRRIARNG